MITICRREERELREGTVPQRLGTGIVEQPGNRRQADHHRVLDEGQHHFAALPQSAEPSATHVVSRRPGSAQTPSMRRRRAVQEEVSHGAARKTQGE